MKKKLIIVTLVSLINVLAFAQTATNEEFPPLNVDDFAAKIKKTPNPQIVDVRTSEEFAINHITGAINIDVRNKEYGKDLLKLDKDRPVFIYAIQNYRPGLLSKELRGKGYKEVYELKSGIGSWIGAGNPYYSSVKNSLSYTDYKKIVTDNRLVLVDIGTKYCGACVKVKELVDSLKNEGDNSYKILELELYSNPELAADLKEIKSVPTVILYKEGQVVWKKAGLTFTKQEIRDAIEKAK